MFQKLIRAGSNRIIEIKNKKEEQLQAEIFQIKMCIRDRYKHTQLQDTFGVIMLALVNNEPKVMNLSLIHI